MNDISAEKLSLGTAQFGMDYGIANKTGAIAEKDAFQLLRYAYESGISYIDTANAYGESERVIGDFLSESNAHFNIVSKMPEVKASAAPLAEEYLIESLKRLRLPDLYAYLVHKFDDILAHETLWRALEAIKERGLTKKIGISIYTPSELEYMLGGKISFDIVQVPYNIFDRRFETYFTVLREKGIEIHTRSVFLQGLFFLDEQKISREFGAAKHMIDKMRRIAKGNNISIQALCLCFTLLNPLIDKVVVGVDSLMQLKENIDSIGRLHEVEKIYGDLRSLQFHDEEIILPHKWKL